MANGIPSAMSSARKLLVVKIGTTVVSAYVCGLGHMNGRQGSSSVAIHEQRYQLRSLDFPSQAFLFPHDSFSRPFDVRVLPNRWCTCDALEIFVTRPT